MRPEIRYAFFCSCIESGGAKLTCGQLPLNDHARSQKLCNSIAAAKLNAICDPKPPIPTIATFFSRTHSSAAAVGTLMIPAHQRCSMPKATASGT